MTVGEIPFSVTVGPMQYTVRAIPELRAEDGQRLNGHILYGPCEIRIDAGLDPQVQRVTLWHEVLHAILTHAGHEDDAEKVVEILSYGLVAALRDNPGLARQ